MRDNRIIERIALGERSYDVIIGSNLLADLSQLLKPVMKNGSIFLVVDAKVEEIHGAAISRALVGMPVLSKYVVASGEQSKSIASFEALSRHLVSAGITRGDGLVVIGGGVTGDLGGFAAASVLRGVKYVHVPTTMLAQVDSSVGGKVGINLPEGKNLLGAFHHPVRVVADTSLLDSLPPRELRAGLAEVVKYGILGDSDFFDWLSKNSQQILLGGGYERAQAIARSCRAKRLIVEEDEVESGRRALLNLGHTFGHAIEAASHYDGSILHGEAVALGTVMAAVLSHERQWLSAGDLARIRNSFEELELATSFAQLRLRGFSVELSASRFVDYMRRDKKNTQRKLVLILLRAIGEAFVSPDEDIEEITAFVARFLSGEFD